MRKRTTIVLISMLILSIETVAEEGFSIFGADTRPPPRTLIDLLARYGSSLKTTALSQDSFLISGWMISGLSAHSFSGIINGSLREPTSFLLTITHHGTDQKMFWSFLPSIEHLVAISFGKHIYGPGGYGVRDMEKRKRNLDIWCIQGRDGSLLISRDGPSVHLAFGRNPKVVFSGFSFGCMSQENILVPWATLNKPPAPHAIGPKSSPPASEQR